MLLHAPPAFALDGLEGFPPEAAATLRREILGDCASYHLRRGGHGLREDDWAAYLRTARSLLEAAAD